MYYLIIDTCVWIDLCKNFPEVRKKLTELVERQKATLLLPQIVIDEWNRNKFSKIVVAKQESIQGMINSARKLSQYMKSDAANTLGTVLEQLCKKEIAKEIVSDEIDAVDDLFAHPSTIIPPLTIHIKAQAADLALTKKAPFHKKNSMADALIILSSIEYVKQNSLGNVIFISNNTQDFSATNDKTQIHEDLREIFEHRGIQFFINIGQAINEIENNLVNIEQVHEIDKSRELYIAKSAFQGYQEILKGMKSIGGISAIGSALDSLADDSSARVLQEALKSARASSGIASIENTLQTIDSAGGIVGLQDAAKSALSGYEEMMEGLSVIEGISSIASALEGLADSSSATALQEALKSASAASEILSAKSLFSGEKELLKSISAAEGASPISAALESLASNNGITALQEALKSASAASEVGSLKNAFSVIDSAGEIGALQKILKPENLAMDVVAIKDAIGTINMIGGISAIESMITRYEELMTNTARRPEETLKTQNKKVND